MALVAAALSVPAAIADNAGSAGLKKDVKKALKQSKKAKKKASAANKKANQALATAEETSKKEGPAGPAGPQGPIGPAGLQMEGEFRISTNDWRPPDEQATSSVYLQPGTGLVMRLLSSSNAAAGQAVAYPEIPTSLFGESVDLIGMELCYGNSGSTLQLFGLRSWASSADDPKSSSGTSAIATQNTPAKPTGAACERLDLPDPYTLTADDRVAAVVQASLPNANASNLELYRLSIILRATP